RLASSRSGLLELQGHAEAPHGTHSGFGVRGRDPHLPHLVGVNLKTPPVDVVARPHPLFPLRNVRLDAGNAHGDFCVHGSSRVGPGGEAPPGGCGHTVRRRISTPPLSSASITSTTIRFVSRFRTKHTRRPSSSVAPAYRISGGGWSPTVATA